jgi:hypothetical protein
MVLAGFLEAWLDSSSHKAYVGCMEQKECTKCKLDKPVEAFSWRNKGKEKRHPTCKECHKRIWDHPRYQNNKTKWREKANRRRDAIKAVVAKYLEDKSCIDCGFHHPAALEFDHVRGKKLAAVSVLVAHACGLKKIMDEIAKCEVRCSNCHRIRHHNIRCES